MSQNNSNDKAAMLAKIEGINEVEGFDPTPFAVDYTDLEGDMCSGLQDFRTKHSAAPCYAGVQAGGSR